jgi:NADH-quinone oxidoreductase subunit G
MKPIDQIVVDGVRVPLDGERNLLEVIRKAGIDIPTFCYHSELSIYGSCRLCMVDVEGMGIVASCSTLPKNGMVVRTMTEEIQKIRKVNLELLLASHDINCPACPKNETCKLRALAARLGVNEIRYKHIPVDLPKDNSSPSLQRDPAKCIKCGDCVRFCEEIQGIGAIGLCGRGSNVKVTPPFEKGLGNVECINCGGCATVCPTGAITPKDDTSDVWKLLRDNKRKVIAQIAPAVRVALGEMFGMEPGDIVTGKIVTAMKRLGFSYVFDTAFAADLTVMEEAAELLSIVKKGGPVFTLLTSCCPAWIKQAEYFDSDIHEHISSCRSPQQMFGAVARTWLTEKLSIDKNAMSVISIMPCTAKKFEAKRPEFNTDGIQDVDVVLTTQELGRMILESGIDLKNLEPSSFDLPMGFGTGAGMLFGASGGVTEAVIRYVAGQLGRECPALSFNEVDENPGIREATIDFGDARISACVVQGLKNADIIINQIRKKTCSYNIVEIMACPGGCVGGAGQPVPFQFNVKEKRRMGLRHIDSVLPTRAAQDNPFVAECYAKFLKEPGSKLAESLLHTSYISRKRDEQDGIDLGSRKKDEKALLVRVCVGTGCYLRGSHNLLQDLLAQIDKKGLVDNVNVQATFCMESCELGPSVAVGNTWVRKATVDHVMETIDKCLKDRRVNERHTADCNN